MLTKVSDEVYLVLEQRMEAGAGMSFAPRTGQLSMR